MYLVRSRTEILRRVGGKSNVQCPHFGRRQDIGAYRDRMGALAGTLVGNKEVTVRLCDQHLSPEMQSGPGWTTGLQCLPQCYSRC